MHRPLVAVALVLVLALLAGADTAAAALRPLRATAQMDLGVGAPPARLVAGPDGATSLGAGGASAVTLLELARPAQPLRIESAAAYPQLVRLRVLDVDADLRRGAMSIGGVELLFAENGALASTGAAVLLPARGALILDSTLGSHPRVDSALTIGIELQPQDGGPLATQTWTLVLL